MDTAEPGSRPRHAQGGGLAAFDGVLFCVTLFAWGTSWIALKINAATSVPIETSIFYRFVIAGLIMAVWVAIRGWKIRYGVGLHLRFAAMGFTIFSVNFMLYAHASAHLVSGLMAVMFSSVAILNVLVAAAVFRQPLDPKVLVAALVGVSGLVLIFYPEIAGQDFDPAALGAIGLCLVANLLFCTGNMMSAHIQKRGVPVVEANMIGMLYGMGWSFLAVLVRGEAFIFEVSIAYVGSLAILAILSSVIAFAAYLTLLGRQGPGRAGYLTVTFPLVALTISTVFEGYTWPPLAIVGLGFVLAGNAIVALSAARAR
ncbi:MAG: DMT family transporter [Pseudomonadota bacterium]